MSLRKQIEQLAPGETFTIPIGNRAPLFVAAKRAGIGITTQKVGTELIVTRKGEPVPELSLAERVTELSPKDRLALFENFELCCGMNRGECVCPKETIPAGTKLVDLYPDGIVANPGVAGPGLIVTDGGFGSVPSGLKSVSDTWIEMPTTYENGEVLYWHRQPKGKPVCYRRESDLNAV